MKLTKHVKLIQPPCVIELTVTQGVFIFDVISSHSMRLILQIW